MSCKITYGVSNNDIVKYLSNNIYLLNLSINEILKINILKWFI